MIVFGRLIDFQRQIFFVLYARVDSIQHIIYRIRGSASNGTESMLMAGITVSASDGCLCYIMVRKKNRATCD